MPQIPPRIIAINQLVAKTQLGIPYVQEVAQMDDASQWEVPCIGNGNLWRKITKSMGELQAEFDMYYIALVPQALQNKHDGEGNTNHNSPTSSSSKRK